jgi:murein DD-endopeptidase MepM/ murein hydrolase activator NlpD
MKVENKSKSKIIKFLNGKGFYAVLCVCFLAIGIAAWSGVEGYRNLQITDNSSLESVTETPYKPSPDNTEQLQLPSEVIKPDEGTDDKKEETPSEEKLPTAEETAGPIAAFFVNPVLGEVIKGYSDKELQYSMTFCDMRLHKGIDIKATEGTPVMASGDGIVTDIYTDALLGTVVEIDHGNKVTAKYCGLNSAPTVKKGDKVDSSKQIGAVDKIPSESVEEYHLHLEFYVDGKSVSPSDYILQ